MAYADSIRTTSCDMSTVASLLDGLVLSYSQTLQTAAYSTSSASATDITGATVTTAAINSGERILVYGAALLSISTAAPVGKLYIREGGSTQAEVSGREPFGATSGNTFLLRTMIVLNPGASSAHTYKLSYSTGSGTIYTSKQVIWAAVFQKS